MMYFERADGAIAKCKYRGRSKGLQAKHDKRPIGRTAIHKTVNVHVIADYPKRCDIGRMAKGSIAAGLTSSMRAAVLMVAAVGSIANAASPQRIVAVGDLHGDYAAWTAIARAAGLI